LKFLCAKKSNLRREDFLALGRTLQIPEKVLQTTIERQIALREVWSNAVQASFLSPEMKRRFITLIVERIERLLRT
jgi:hypothetical protein